MPASRHIVAQLVHTRFRALRPRLVLGERLSEIGASVVCGGWWVGRRGREKDEEKMRKMRTRIKGARRRWRRWRREERDKQTEKKRTSRNR